MNRLIPLSVAVISLFFILLGCGYRFAGEEVGLKKVGVSIYVAPLENSTREAYVDSFLRSAIMDWFLKATRLKVVTREEEADLVLVGKVRNMYTVPISYRLGNIAAEERVQVKLEVSLKERRSGKIVWEEKEMVGEQDYSVVDVNRREDARRSALIKLANDMGERIYRPITARY